MRNYSSPAYAHERLAGTIARVNDRPAMIGKITAKKVQFQPLDTLNIDAHQEEAPIEQLDINPVPLGYCNCKGTDAVYLMRQPVRRDWKQGLRFQTLLALQNSRFINSNTVRYEDIAKTIIGDYPKFGDIFESVCTFKKLKANSIAFSRTFAIRSTFEVVYKEQFIIGKLDLNANPEKGGVIDIDPKMEWVIEELEASVKW